jgi:hypothetical protein
MKIRLLKKIRKRYSIIRVDKLASDADEFMIHSKNFWGLPFFVLRDNNGDGVFDNRTQAYGDLQDAKNKIVKYVVSDYREKFRHINGKQTKVWYNK